jgi:hypothetical protein
MPDSLNWGRNLFRFRGNFLGDQWKEKFEVGVGKIMPNEP